MLQEQVDWYEQWFGTPYYHILYQNRDHQEASAFVEKLIEFLQPKPDSKMVDIACGEGRHSRQLAQYGFDVTGLDLAAESIQTATNYEQENLHFFVHDMRESFYINYFDYAFNFFTSFGYFEKQRDHNKAAKSFAGCLKKEGILVVDYLNKEKALKNMVAQHVVQRDALTFHISKRFEQQHFIKHIQFTDDEGVQHHFKESVAAFSLEDFKTMFAEAGLSLTHTFGDYQLGAYDEQASPRMIMIFKKQ